MTALYVIPSGKVAAPSATTKVAIQIATGANITCKVVGFDISFDGADATKTPIRVALVQPTAAGSGGSAVSPILQAGGKTRTAQFTARISDTTAGSSGVVYASWEVSPTSGFSYQFPLGREFELDASEFLELQVITVAGSGTPNYDAVLWVEE